MVYGGYLKLRCFCGFIKGRNGYDEFMYISTMKGEK